MFLRKDGTKYLVIRVYKLIRKTTIYAKIAFSKNKRTETGTVRMLSYFNHLLKILISVPLKM